MENDREKWIDKLCEKIVCMGEHFLEKFCRKWRGQIVWQSFVGILGERNRGKNVVGNCVEKVVGKIRLKNGMDKFNGKVVLKNCINNWIDNFVEKSNGQQI